MKIRESDVSVVWPRVGFGWAVVCVGLLCAPSLGSTQTLKPQASPEQDQRYQRQGLEKAQSVLVAQLAEYPSAPASIHDALTRAQQALTSSHQAESGGQAKVARKARRKAARLLTKVSRWIQSENDTEPNDGANPQTRQQRLAQRLKRFAAREKALIESASALGVESDSEAFQTGTRQVHTALQGGRLKQARVGLKSLREQLEALADRVRTAHEARVDAMQAQRGQ